MTERPIDSEEDRTRRDAEVSEPPGGGISRRKFLVLTGGAVAAAGGAGLLAGTRIEDRVEIDPITPSQGIFPDHVQESPTAVPPDTPLRFFTRPEAEVIEAFTARIIPGDADDPGAREAGVVTYIDRMLAAHEGWPEPVYGNPPYAEPVDGPGSEELVDGVIQVNQDELERYGDQYAATPREIYRLAVVVIESQAEALHGTGFAQLPEELQDELVEMMAEDEMPGFTTPSAEAVFGLIREHTIQGMFSDPVYGGNRELVGWWVIGYPGAQRAYTPAEVGSEGTDRAPQGILDLPHFHPGVDENDVTSPVRRGAASAASDPESWWGRRKQF